MRAIRGRNTSPELSVRKLLFAKGFRYRLHVRDMPGSPDIVLKKRNTVVLVHGCFWHRHGCYRFKWPRTNKEFWAAKIEANVTRDERDLRLLIAAGWNVVCVWECALIGRLKWETDALSDAIASSVLAGKTSPAYIQIEHCSEFSGAPAVIVMPIIARQPIL
ncbi:very short patch repair endonuclease [Massilia sp. P8910]|nr:very short patch repair endonuclease [Massilia antarctica]